MMRPVIAVVLATVFITQSMIAQEARSLTSFLNTFDQEHDLAKKDRDLQDLIKQYPQAGPSLLMLAQATRYTDTKWMAIRGMGDLQFRDCEPFLRKALTSPDALVRSNAARVIRDLEFHSAEGDLIAMFALERDPRAIEQASLSLSNLKVEASVPLIRQKIPQFAGQTREWLLQALGRLGNKSDVPLIAGYLSTPDPAESSTTAVDAIEEITGVNFGPRQTGPQGIPTFRTMQARSWWQSHRENWPRCDDCHFK